MENFMNGPNPPPTKKEEEDEILKKIIDEYNIDGIKETMDETGQIPESIYFFLWRRQSTIS